MPNQVHATYAFQTLQPGAQFLQLITVLLARQRIDQTLAYTRIEQAQCQGLPIALMEAVRGIVGLYLQQLALTHPGTFQGLGMGLPYRPGMKEKFQLRKLSEQQGIVIRQLDELAWLEFAIRFVHDAFPG
ncbi:hypothetical protein D3C79_919940 [compost metagenome]